MKLGMGARPWAGLDIGTYSVKLVALQPGAARGRYAEAAIPRALAGEDPPAPAILAGLIVDCMGRLGIAARAFAGISIGVSGPDVIVKQIPLPLMDEAEIAGALRFEAKKHLPFDVQTLVLDHQVLARNTAERRLDVLLATVSQQRLDRALAPLRELGLEAAIVDAAPLALANALVHTLARESAPESDARLLLDLGHRGSWLTLRQKGLPFFSRRIDWGGAVLAEAVAATVNGSRDIAESWKIDPASSILFDTAESFAARHAVEQLGDEVRRSLAFYGTLAPLPATLPVHVSGGTSRIGGLCEVLAHRLGLGVTPFSPLDAIERGVKVHAGGPQFALAYGLALRAA
jgi:type IV pilus assembly protein PilM